MARLLAAISTCVALLVGGLITLAFLMPAKYIFVIPVVIVLVVVGVNITAWLVVPRVIRSALPVPSTSVDQLMGGPYVFGRGGSDWSTSEFPSDDWSSSWDYAGGDSPDGPDDDDRRFGEDGRFGDDHWFTRVGGAGGYPFAYAHGHDGHGGNSDHMGHMGHMGHMSADGGTWGSSGWASDSSSSSGSSGSDTSSPSSTSSSDSSSGSSW